MISLPGLHRSALRDLVQRVYHEFGENDVLTYANALAFRLTLALFPFLIFLLALASFLPIEPLIERLLSWSRTVLPPQALEPVGSVIRRFNSRQTGALSLGLLATIWAAAGGIRSTMTALNRAYDLEEDRSWPKRYALSIAYTLALGALLLLGMAFMLLGPQAVQWLAARVGLAAEFASFWRWARYPVAILLLMFGASLAYTLLPNGVRFRLITPGAIAAVLLWVLAALGFQLYVGNFGRFQLLYGSVGAVLVLLLFLWISALAILLGGVLNGAILTQRRERRNGTSPAAKLDDQKEPDDEGDLR